MMARSRCLFFLSTACSAALSAQTTAPLAPGTPRPAAATAPSLAAQLFGARQSVNDISLSPDGRFIAYVASTSGPGTEVRVLDTASGKTTRVLTASGKPLRFTSCGWASNTRVVCKLFARLIVTGSFSPRGRLSTLSRTVAVNWDGSGRKFISGLAGVFVEHTPQYDGDVIDWHGGNGNVLITHDWNNTPSSAAGYNNSFHTGFGVDQVNTQTGRLKLVEAPNSNVSLWLADGAGKVRMRGVDQFESAPDTSKPDPADPRQLDAANQARKRQLDRSLNQLSIDPDADSSDVELDVSSEADLSFNGTTNYQYRDLKSRKWLPFSKVTSAEPGLLPIAIDGGRNVAYATQPFNGHIALFRVPLDGSLKPQVVSSNDAADVTGVVRIGDDGHVIGATYDTVTPTIDYFDPVYRDLAQGLSRQLAGKPTIRFVSADAKEHKMVVLISSATDPGHYDVYDSEARAADDWLASRAPLGQVAIAPTTPVSFPASAGNTVQAMLTLPASGAKTGLPAIVLARGGDYRDFSGFDWIAQYFAYLGYAVIQPSLRGSQEVSDDWYTAPGTDRAAAVADMRDAASWLVKQGIADPKRVAAMGWSWGGYAALATTVANPDLFKAVIGVASVTSVPTGKQVIATNADMVVEDNVVAGSPVRDAKLFKAPVLLFHGDADLDINVDSSKKLDSALRGAGKASELVIFPKLDHDLNDGNARAAMLDKSAAFLRTAMGGPLPATVTAGRPDEVP